MNKINEGLFSSSNIEYETPQWLFDHFNSLFNFELDVCASKENAKCKNWLSEKDNGLEKSWLDRNWMNPPYGREISKWLKKAYDESKKGNLIVCLLPARTDTRWWHTYVLKADAIHFIKGRLKFSGSNSSAPFPSAIVIFGLFNYKR